MSSIAVKNPVLPERSLCQQMAALQRANDTRSRRARLKEQLKADGKVGAREHVSQLLFSPPEFTATMKVWDLLIAQPAYGRVKTNKVLARARISPSKTVGGMSERQRLELVQILRRG